MTDPGPPLRLRPFRAVSYAPGIDLASVTCPPYDMISKRARDEFEAADQHNIVRLTLPRDRDTAVATYRRWLDDGVLQCADEPTLCVYERRTTDGTAIGLVGGIGLDGPVLPHENTFPGPVADRAALMSAMGAQLEPILLTYDGGGAASDVVDEIATTEPDRTMTLGAAEEHRLWRIANPRVLAEIETDLASRTALIADGHHRFAAYRAVHATAPRPGTAEGLALLVDATRHPLLLRGIHRSIAGLSFEHAVATAAEGFEKVLALAPDDTITALPGSTARPGHDLWRYELERGAFVVADADRRVVLRGVLPRLLEQASSRFQAEEWRRLDAAVLVGVLMAELWAIDDENPRVTYHHDTTDAVRQATETSGTAVLVAPPPLEDVLNLATQGIRMPRKSTSFGPKPWTGLLMRDTTR